MRPSTNIISIACLLLTTIAFAQEKPNIVKHLQDVSCTIKTDRGQGSGVITKVCDTNYVLTAAHVVDSLRKTRKVVENGVEKTVVEFDDAKLYKDLVEDGRTVGNVEFNAEVVRYSDADNGEDIALLLVRKKNLSEKRVKFYIEKEIPALGTELYHVGSLLGVSGSNSLTTGIISQHGRLINKTVYDQTTCTAFPGSSGGGVFTKNDGAYIGMLVRGAGEGFNLIVPVRRVIEYGKRTGIDFIFDEKAVCKTPEEIKKGPIEECVIKNEKK